MTAELASVFRSATERAGLRLIIDCPVLGEMVYVDREALEARGLTLMNVVHALNDSNLIIPAGDAKIADTDYFIYTNSMIEDTDEINNVPVKIGDGSAPVLVRRGRRNRRLGQRAH